MSYLYSSGTQGLIYKHSSALHSIWYTSSCCYLMWGAMLHSLFVVPLVDSLLVQCLYLDSEYVHYVCVWLLAIWSTMVQCIQLSHACHCSSHSLDIWTATRDVWIHSSCYFVFRWWRLLGYEKCGSLDSSMLTRKASQLGWNWTKK